MNLSAAVGDKTLHTVEVPLTGFFILFKGAYNFRPCIMWRYKGQKRIQKMQYFFWAMYPFFKLVGMWNMMSEVAEAMIAVTKYGYEKATIECRDISKLAKQ